MNAAFIPVRGGSKSIPLKNIKILHGKPLVYWTIRAAVESRQVDRVYVSTDSQIIKNTVEGFGFSKTEVIARSEQSASDTASTESAMIEFAEKYEFDNIILIQATSPMLKAEDIDGGFELYYREDTDSVLSAVRQYRFHWQTGRDGYVQPVNYDPAHRPRRQDFAGYLTENGAYYITSRKRLLKYQCRLSGNIRAYEMHEDTLTEIDTTADWVIVEQLMKQKQQDHISVIAQIRMFLTDCDGCLTDGGMYYSKHGEELKKFNTRDGMGIVRLREAGIITGIVTGEDAQAVKKRAEKLGMEEVHTGVRNKLALVQGIAQRHGIRMEEIAYVGDDLNDREVICAVGFGCCVHDAVQNVKDCADYVSSRNGGDGAVREIADKIIYERERYGKI